MAFTTAIVLTDSADDPQARVKLKATGVWDESPLIPSVNAIPLNKDDEVYVDVTNLNTPLILGIRRTAQSTYDGSNSGDGSVLVRSKQGSDFTEIDVKGKNLFITVGKTTITIKDGQMDINNGSNKGLVNVEELKKIIDAFYSALQSLSTQLTSHPVVGNGVPLTLPPTWFTSLAPKKQIFEQKVEDTKVTH